MSNHHDDMFKRVELDSTKPEMTDLICPIEPIFLSQIHSYSHNQIPSTPVYTPFDFNLNFQISHPMITNPCDPFYIPNKILKQTVEFSGEPSDLEVPRINHQEGVIVDENDMVVKFLTEFHHEDDFDSFFLEKQDFECQLNKHQRKRKPQKSDQKVTSILQKRKRVLRIHLPISVSSPPKTPRTPQKLLPRCISPFYEINESMKMKVNKLFDSNVQEPSKKKRKLFKSTPKVTKKKKIVEMDLNFNTDPSNVNNLTARMLRCLKREEEKVKRHTFLFDDQSDSDSDDDSVIFEPKIRERGKKRGKGKGKGKGKIKSRKKSKKIDIAKRRRRKVTFKKKDSGFLLPQLASNVMQKWMLKNIIKPYPSKEDKSILIHKSGLSLTQVTNWFSNIRKRKWSKLIDFFSTLEESDMETEIVKIKESDVNCTSIGEIDEEIGIVIRSEFGKNMFIRMRRAYLKGELKKN